MVVTGMHALLMTVFAAARLVWWKCFEENARDRGVFFALLATTSLSVVVHDVVYAGPTPGAFIGVLWLLMHVALGACAYITRHSDEIVPAPLSANALRVCTALVAVDMLSLVLGVIVLLAALQY